MSLQNDTNHPSADHAKPQWVEKVVVAHASESVVPMSSHRPSNPSWISPAVSTHSKLTAAKFKPTILCFGEPLIEQRLMSPQGLPATVTLAPSGDVLNTAVAFSRLCPPYENSEEAVSLPQVTIVTRLGQDSYGDMIAQYCQKEGIALVSPWHGLRDKQRYTGSYLLAETGSSEYYRHQSAGACVHEDTPAYSEAYLASLLGEHAWVYATGVSLALSESYRQLIMAMFRYAKVQGRSTMLTLNWRDKLWQGRHQLAYDTLHALLPYVDSLQLSQEDAQGWLQMTRSQSVQSYFQEIHRVPMLWYTLAQAGSHLYTLNPPGQHRSQIPTHSPSSVVQNHVLPALSSQSSQIRGSSLGAGDAFAGGVLYGLVARQPLALCHALGRLVAGLKCHHPQTALGMPSRDEVMCYEGV
jgi:sugar/nucleoside kinase (ribokinase family)